MSSGTGFTADIFIRDVHIKSDIDLSATIEEQERTIADIQQRIAMYASSTPKDVVPDDWNDPPVDYVFKEIKNLVEWMLDEHTVLVNLWHMKHNKTGEDVYIES